MKLGVNIDHVATVREARKTFEPDPVMAVAICEESGCDGIVCHLRKDRRHINDKDLTRIKDVVKTKLNLEMSLDPEIVDIACSIVPDQATLVPENRQEITTEGGLDVRGNFERVKAAVDKLHACGIETSLFIDPEKDQIEATEQSGAKVLEFHTGKYAEEFYKKGDTAKELHILKEMTQLAKSKGLTACAGHGLTYDNVSEIAKIDGIYELNIGHSIIAKSIFIGLGEAVKIMKGLTR